MDKIFSFPKNQRVIDGHIHIHNWFIDNEPKENDRFENYILDVKDYIARTNLEYLNVAAIVGKGKNFSFDQNILCAILKLECDKVFVHGGLCHPIQPVKLPIPKDFDFVLQVKEMEKLGFDGMKMVEGKPNSRKALGLPLDSPALDDYYSYLEQQGTHLTFHVNDPDEFWDRTKVSQIVIDSGWLCEGPGFLSYEEHYKEAFNVLKKHPKLHVTFAHLFFMSKEPKRLTDLLDAYPNMCIDITPGEEMYINMGKDIEQWKEIFIKYSDRILYGTDFVCGLEPMYMNERCRTMYNFLTSNEKTSFGNEEFVGMGLDDEIVDKILYQNFVNKVSATPKRIDKKYLSKYIEKYLPLTQNEHNRKMILEYADKNL